MNPRPIHPPNPSHKMPSLENGKIQALNDMGNVNNKKKKRKSTMISNKHDKVSQKSAEKVAGNEDLLSEILLRLPVRSLVRLKCVSKPWLLLISSSHFCHTHSRKNFSSLAVSGFIIPNGTRKLDYVGLDGARPKFAPSLEFMKKSHVKIIQSCNGLMLCSTFKRRDGYYVCNPTTRKFSSISLPPLAAPGSLYEFECGINLIFDPSRSPHFMVVNFTLVIEPHNRLSPVLFTFSTHLYSSNSQSWSSIESPERAFFHSTTLHNGVLCNGSLYWLCRDQWKLLRFEVDKQRFSTITMNVDSNLVLGREEGDSVSLWQCKGKLYFVHEVIFSDRVVVYEMGNVCSEWLVKYMVKFPDAMWGIDTHDYVDGDEDEEFCIYNFLAAVGGPEDDDGDDMRLLVKLVYNIRETEVILYSIKEKTTTKMMFSSFDEEVQPYIESLSPVI